MNISCCMCESMETAQSPGDDTSSCDTAKRRAQSTDHAQSVHCVGVLRAWPIERWSNKHMGKNEHKTPTPCEDQAKTKEKQTPQSTGRKTAHLTRFVNMELNRVFLPWFSAFFIAPPLCGIKASITVEVGPGPSPA